MKNITEYIMEQLSMENDHIEVSENENEIIDAVEVVESEESIDDEESFRAAAKAKFEEVFGDDLDEKKMNDTIEGILNDNQDLVDDGEWGKLIGILNKSFAK